MFSTVDYIYLALVLAGTVGFLLWVLHLITQRQESRHDKLNSRATFEAISLKRKTDRFKSDAVKLGMESINTRFRIIRILLVCTFPVVIVVLLVLPKLYDWPASYLSFIFGSITVVIGIAAKPFLENIIAGLVISFSNPLRIGDTVLIKDHYGTVEKIGMIHTVIKVWDWRRWVVPNSEMIKQDFLNYSLHNTDKWAYVEFFVSPDTNLERVKEISINCAKKSKYFASYEEPTFWVMNIDKDSIKCWIAAWATTPANAWELRSDTRRYLIEEFQNEGMQTQKFSVHFPSAANI